MNVALMAAQVAVMHTATNQRGYGSAAAGKANVVGGAGVDPEMDAAATALFIMLGVSAAIAIGIALLVILK